MRISFGKTGVRPRRWSTAFVLSVTCGLVHLADASAIDTNHYFTVEQRADNEKDNFAWDYNGSQLTMNRIIYSADNDISFYFMSDGNGYYHVGSEFSTGLMDADGGGVGAPVLFEPFDGSDDQLWRIQNLGDGFYRFLNKASGLALAYDDDTDPSPDYTDSVAVLADPASGNRTEWVLRPSVVTPEKCIGLNQNGWAPAQTKIAVLTREEGGAAPSFSVTGPENLSGTMTYWGDKWEMNFYQADLSALTTIGHYTITVDGISQNFSIIADPFENVRADRGGVVEWGDIVAGILEAQRVKAPGDYLEEAIGHEGVPTYLGTYSTLDGGFYDASSLDNKIYRTAQIYRSLAIGYMETSSTTKRAQIIGTLRDGIDWLDRTQQPDGSWHLGKVRVGGDVYYWSTDKDPGGVSQVVISMAATADALAADDPVYSAKALALAESGWDWVLANSEDADFYSPSGGYFGSQNTLIGAAIELYLATGLTEYKTYADTHILEAEYTSNYGMYRSTGTPWPGTATKRDFYIGIYLSRYHPVADAAVQTAIETQLNNLVTYYVDSARTQTPWNICEHQGAVQVKQGWFRSSASFAHALIEVARVLGTQKALDAAMAEWDAVVGNNPWASNCFAGGRGDTKIPLWHQPMQNMTGAVIPGPQAEYVLGVSTNLTFENSGFGHTEQVVMTSLPIIPFWAIANKLLPPQGGAQAPEFYAATFDAVDAVVNSVYTSSIADAAFDSNGDALTFSKVSGPSWLSVATDGALSGTALIGDKGLNTFLVEVSDGTLSSQSSLEIDVTDFRAPVAPTFLISEPVVEDTYSRAPSPDAVNGSQIKMELRTQSGGDTYSRFAYLKFNISGITGTVQSVKLHVHSISESDPIEVYSVDSAWSESTLTWNNQPTGGTQLGILTPSIGAYAAVDLTGYITADGTYSVQLKETGNSVGNITSKEGGQGAYLEVVCQVPANTPPVWDYVPYTAQSGDEDVAYSRYINWTATDADNDPLTFARVSGPSWVSVSASGRLTGTPTQADVGTNVLVVSVSDGVNEPVFNTVYIPILNVNDAPVFSTDPISLPNADKLIAYAGLLAGLASDVDGDALTYNKQAGAEWLTVAANGDLSGTPGDADLGTNVWTVAVDDGNGGTDTATLQIIVNENLPATWNASSFTKPDATKGVAYKQWLNSRVVEPEGQTWYVTKVSGPAWLSVTSATTGKIEGTPSQADVGASVFEFAVDDGVNVASTATVTIVVIDVNAAPIFTLDPITGTAAQETTAYTGSLSGSATDADSDPLSYVKLFGPSWLSVAADGTLSGTPLVGDAGLNSFTVEVSDGNGGTDSAILEISVSPLSLPAAIVNPTPSDGARNINTPATLTWDAVTADTYRVYFGTDAGNLALVSTQTGTSWTTGSLPKRVYHYWRVDSVNAAGTTTGTVWSFKSK